MNIGTLLPRHARYRGDHPALAVGESRLSYRQLNAEVNRLANALLAVGLSKGDKVSTVLNNCLELVLMYWAAAKTGIVIVPNSTMLQAEGLKSLLNDSDTVCVIADAAFASILLEIRPGLSAIADERFILVGSSQVPHSFTKDRNFNP